MSEYTKSVRVTAPLHHAFEKSMEHFRAEDYLPRKAYPYRLLELARSGSIWTGHEINATHKLTVHFNRIGDDVIMRFEYYCSRGLVSFTNKSKRMADETIAVLCSSIRTSKPRDLGPDRICVNCKVGISDDAKFCTYCGHDVDRKGMG